MWDIREDAIKLKSTVRDAGVTSIFQQSENNILIGSYDEKLTSYDLRNLKRPTDDVNLHGGVWRIKRSKLEPNRLLVACMYHNFSIVDITSELKLIGEYFGHESICYGCDWSPKNNNNSEIFAACSFYDHKLSLCRVEL